MALMAAISPADGFMSGLGPRSRPWSVSEMMGMMHARGA